MRLKYGFVVRCTGFSKDAQGKVDRGPLRLLPETKSGTPGADAYKVKGVIHWVCARAALGSEVRLYDRLFKVETPGKASKDYLDDLNPDSIATVSAYLEPCLADAKPDERFQFERHGYFKRDGNAFIRIVTLRDSWGGKK